MVDVYDPTARRRRARASAWWAAPGVIVAALTLPCVAIAFALGMPGTGAFLSLWLTLALWSTAVRGAMPALIVCLTPLLGSVYWTLPFAELDHAARATLDQARSGTPPSDTTLSGWLAVHGAMIAGAWGLGMTEVAAEAFELHREGPAERAWTSDFALADPTVRAAAHSLAEDARGGARSLDPRIVSWPEYGANERSLAVALALNCPLYLHAAVIEPGPDPLIRYQARCKVDYPAQAPLVLVRTALHRYTLDEGVFHLLEEAGRLHPYEAVWTFELRASDPRLEERTTAQLGVGERLALAISALLTGER